jgi:hypothetical protein
VEKGRIVIWFSCGAASAVAAKLVLQSGDKRKESREIVIARNWISEEHPDNDRFEKACAEWLGHPIIHVTNEGYNGSIFEVQDDVKFLRHPMSGGAPCTRLLKKEMRKAFQQAGDIHVFGLHVGEEDRADKFLDGEPDIDVWFPLIESGLTKLDCHKIISEAGIAMAAMYRLGYDNNNCIGCVKGGMGYWNKIRRDFPDAFERMAKQERKLGHSICKKEIRVDGKRVSLPLFLDELKITDGKPYKDEPPIKCGIICEAPTQTKGE